MNPKIEPFPRKAVRLLDGPIKDRQMRNAKYLLDLDLDRLIHNFRINAGLATSAKPLGGWESPGCGLRGHFTGHYLTACAQMYSATGDDRFFHRVSALVDELERCQKALGGEYLSAFPQSAFDTLEQQFGGGGIWAPYYTIHKIMVGLLDAFRECGDDRALAVAGRLGNWITRRLQRLPGETLEKMLRTNSLNPLNEYGGIGESLYDLYAITGKTQYLETAKIFDRDWFLSPLIERRDELAGLHANTHIPQALAAVRRFELTGDQKYLRAVEYFWERTALARSYVNGGSSGPRPDRKERSEGGEHWPDAHKLSGTLTPKINESCVIHNMLRLTDALFRLTGDPRYADFRERAFLNSVLSMQHPEQIGTYIYSHPLASGSRKVFGDAENTFWCCYGTSIEAFARLADGVYFHHEDTLWLNQFLASEATWADKGLRVTQQTNFPYDPRTRLTIHTNEPREFTLALRVPVWASGPTYKLNLDQPVECEPGKTLSMGRIWRDGETIELTLPMNLRFEPMPDDPSVLAFLYGPTVLAARTPHGLELAVPAPGALEMIRPVDPARPHFQIQLGSAADVPLVPLNEIGDEAFGVYFKTPAKN